MSEGDKRERERERRTRERERVSDGRVKSFHELSRVAVVKFMKFKSSKFNP